MVGLRATLNLCLTRRKVGLETSFVRGTTTWKLLGIWTSWTIWFCTLSLTKCRSSLKCLDLECMTGFALKSTTPRLLENIWGGGVCIQSSWRKDLS